MAQIIDARQSGGEVVVLGKYLALPNSNEEVFDGARPLAGALRYNPDTKRVEAFVATAGNVYAWGGVGSGSGGGGDLPIAYDSGTKGLTLHAKEMTLLPDNPPVDLISGIDLTTNSETWSIDHDAVGRLVFSYQGTTAVVFQPSGAVTGTFVGTSNMPVVNDGTTARSLVLGDAGGYIRMTSNSANTITVPTNATVAFPIGTQITILQKGTGQTTIAGASGVLINTPATLKLRKQHSVVALLKVAANEWDIMGDLAEA